MNTPKRDEEDSDWFMLSAAGLEAAYGDDEPEYTPDLVIELNPEYEGDWGRDPLPRLR